MRTIATGDLILYILAFNFNECKIRPTGNINSSYGKAIEIRISIQIPRCNTINIAGWRSSMGTIELAPQLEMGSGLLKSNKRKPEVKWSCRNSVS
jgi:hypothetical protein